MAPRSDIWSFFVKNSKSGVCKKCGSIVKTSGNTRNLWNHLNRHHPQQLLTGKKITDDLASDSEGSTPKFSTKTVMNQTQNPFNEPAAGTSYESRRVNPNQTIKDSFTRMMNFKGKYDSIVSQLYYSSVKLRLRLFLICTLFFRARRNGHSNK